MKTDGKNINQLLDTVLANYAQKNSASFGRIHTELSDQKRTPFQRDRDRIIHASAFRRLKGKTQVVSPATGDHFRNRLTHTLEVAQIARDLSRELRLNEDLAETIALAHDLGHPPFGHAGETILHQKLFAATGKKFEHNQQSLRVLNLLEPRYKDFLGLNLTWEVREGLKKHDTTFTHPITKKIIFSPHLESQVVDIADEIAYLSADLEDALRGNFITMKDLESIEICQMALKKLPESEKNFRPSLIRGVMRILIQNLAQNIQHNLEKHQIKNLADIQNFSGGRLAVFDSAMYQKFKTLKSFLMEKYYRAPAVVAVTNSGQTTIAKIFDILEKNPNFISNYDEKSEKYQQIVDFIAGMTDNFAEAFCKKHL